MKKKIYFPRITEIKLAIITKPQQDDVFQIVPDIRFAKQNEIPSRKVVLRSSGTMTLEMASGVQSYKTEQGRSYLHFSSDGGGLFSSESGTITVYLDGRFFGATDLFMFDGRADVILVIAEELSEATLERPVMKTLEKLLPYFFVFVWIGIMFDKLADNPWFSLPLILGIIVIYYGGKLIVGKALQVIKE